MDARRGAQARPPWTRCGGRAVLLALLLVPVSGCGRKGPPLPPLVRVPAAVSEIAARRLGDDVYVTFTVPAQNVDGSRPVFLDRVELRALVASEVPGRAAFIERSSVVAALPVRASDAESPESPAPPDAVAAGASITIRDQLVPVDPAQRPSDAAGAASYRYYLAVPSSGRRTSSSGTIVAVPIGPTPPAPDAPALAFRPRTDEHAADLTLTWAPIEGADGYNVYRADSTGADTGEREAAPAVAPTPVNAAPLEEPRFSERGAYEESRCYAIRSVRRGEGQPAVESALSTPVCATPVDTVAPMPPEDVAALAGDGEITIVWTGSPEPDVIGYLILRGRPGDDTLAGITASPVTGTRYVDRTVTPGVRYAYAVVAVDSRKPDGNRSLPSTRDEATAR